jgi:uncharacterized membrane protein YkvA (DUF1232 family)
MPVFSRSRAGKVFSQKQESFTEADMARVIRKRKILGQKFAFSSRLRRYASEFRLLFSMLNDYYHRRYREVPWYIISSIGAALLYVLTPIDLLPDFIPLIGYIDDASVFALCLNLARKEVKKYQDWKEYFDYAQ